MANLLKTIETPHDPCLIVTNDSGDERLNGCVLVGFHWFDGEDIVAPRLSMNDGKSVLMDQDQLRSAIEALSEFLEEDHEDVPPHTKQKDQPL